MSDLARQFAVPLRRRGPRRAERYGDVVGPALRGKTMLILPTSNGSSHNVVRFLRPSGVEIDEVDSEVDNPPFRTPVWYRTQ